MTVLMTVEVTGKGDGWEQVPICQVSLPRITIQPPALEKGYSEQDGLLDGNSLSLPKSPHSTERETEARREQGTPSGTQVLLFGEGGCPGVAGERSHRSFSV